MTPKAGSAVEKCYLKQHVSLGWVPERQVLGDFTPVLIILLPVAFSNTFI
jgi:hypothetical protein